MKRMVKDISKSEYTIQKSKFISLVYPIKDSFHAKEILKEIRKENSDATHVIYAYLVNNEAHSNDDGEPKGTAGLPTLELIRKNEIENVLIATIRYFGGIKLGASGLLRAYIKSATLALENAKFLEQKNTTSFNFTIKYEQKQGIDKLINMAINYNCTYETNLSYSVKIYSSDYEYFKNELEDKRGIKMENINEKEEYL